MTYLVFGGVVGEGTVNVRRRHCKETNQTVGVEVLVKGLFGGVEFMVRI